MSSNRSKTPPDELSEHEGSSDESALSRWSRRKQQAGRDSSEPGAEGSQDAQSSPSSQLSSQLDSETDADNSTALANSESGSANTVDQEQEERALTDADMPDVETLTPDSDFKPFMSKGVSHALRRKALRKLFASPFFQIRDGLDDYDEDFRHFVPLGDTVTADMKFMEKHKEDLRLEAEREAEEQRLAEEQAAQDQTLAEHDVEPDADQNSSQLDTEQSEDASDADDDALAVDPASQSEAANAPVAVDDHRQQAASIRGGFAAEDFDELSDEDV